MTNVEGDNWKSRVASALVLVGLGVGLKLIGMELCKMEDDFFLPFLLFLLFYCWISFCALNPILVTSCALLPVDGAVTDQQC